jgi:hypothetical protein
VILLVHPGAAGERHERWISAMIWSDDNDPRLVQSESFRSLAELGNWLVQEVARHPPGSITIRWTGDLMAEPDMVRTVADALQVPPPSETAAS